MKYSKIKYCPYKRCIEKVENRGDYCTNHLGKMMKEISKRANNECRSPNRS